MERLGFFLVYLGTAFGVVSAGWAIKSFIRSPSTVRTTESAGRASAVLGVAGAGAALASLWLVWVEGWTPAGVFVEQSAWVALDPVSTSLSAVLACVVLVLGIRGEPYPAPWRFVGCCACLAVLVSGNVVIQAATTRGSHLRYGAYVAAVGAGLVLLAALIAAVRAERASIDEGGRS